LVAGLLGLITYVALTIEVVPKTAIDYSASEYSAPGALRVCKILVQGVLDRRRFFTTTPATYAPVSIKWEEHPHIFVIRGEVTAPSRVPVTDQFVCLIAPYSDYRAYLRSVHPDRYAEMVRVSDP